MDRQQQLLLPRLERNYIAAQARSRAQVSAYVGARWNAMESWHDADIVRWQNEVLPVIQRAEEQTATLTNNYLTTMRNTATGANERPEPLDLSQVTGAALRNGVEPTEVYKRPQMVLNYALSQGATVTEAVTRGLRRAVGSSLTDMELAHNSTVAAQGRSTFRRVLTGSENCALCVIASTQRYLVGTLKPIHPGCDCATREDATLDPSVQVIEPDLLQATHKQVSDLIGGPDDPGAREVLVEDGGGKVIQLRGGSTRAADYTDLIVTNRHSELGPLLGWRDQKFSTLSELESA